MGAQPELETHLKYCFQSSKGLVQVRVPLFRFGPLGLGSGFVRERVPVQVRLRTQTPRGGGFAEDVVTRKSTSGYVFMKNNGAISWAARPQSKVAHSSADSELRALDECIREARWLQRLDTEFYPARATGRPDHKRPITVHEDNRPCIISRGQ